MFKVTKGDVFYDTMNGRVITALSHGCDPKCWECDVEDIYDPEADHDTILLMENELKHMERSMYA